MERLNAIGFLCPRPVIIAKKFIKENNPKEFEVLVDNEIATENLSKMANLLGYKTSITKNDKTYFVNFKLNLDIPKEDKALDDEFVVVLSSDRLGFGDEAFSQKLLEGFIYSLSEKDKIPTFVILYNYGVRLSTINENTISDFKKLEEKGSTILSCGLCLENYNLRNLLKVGEVTNMDKIVDLEIKYKVVKPC